MMQTMMIAMLYKERYCLFMNITIILKLSLQFIILLSGKADPKLLSELFGLDNYLYYNGNCRNDGCLNMMKAAIFYSDIITTVSPTYAQEILTRVMEKVYKSILEMRKYDLYGILNGVDYEIINPATDPQIVEHFDVDTVFKDKIAK